MTPEPNEPAVRRRGRSLLIAAAFVGLIYVGWSQAGSSSSEPEPPIVVISEPEEQELDKTLRIGVNRITFAWDSDGIDPASIELVCLEAPGEVEVLGMELERGSGELTWRIFSDTPGPARFRIAYVTFCY